MRYLTRQKHKIPAIAKAIFQFLQPEEIEILFSQAEKIAIKKNEVLFYEGDAGDSFFVVLSGKLRGTKHPRHKKTEYVLGYWKPGDLIGEINVLESYPRGVTFRATKSSTILKFEIDMIKQYPEIFEKISHYFAKKTAQRLRFLTEVTVHSMEKELEENKKRVALGLLMVTVLTIMCVYMLSLPFLENLNVRLPVTTIISAPLVLILVAIMIMVMKKSGFPWKTFGISIQNWRRYTWEALIFSTPIILILMTAKWVFIHYILRDNSIPLFSPKSSLPGEFSWGLYLFSLISYIILSPGQELIVRGALQSGFFAFLSGKRKKRMWIAIIISNLIFSIPHLHHSAYFALLVLIPGFFWGWLFARQKTLVGVTVSHIFIGVWMIFIVGFEELVLRLG